MKKLFLLVLALFSIAANAQPPVPRSGPAVTAVDYRLGAKLNFYLPHNHGRWMNGGLDSLGMIMYEDSSRHIWYIDTVTGGGHQWTMLLRAGDVPAFNQDSIKHAFVDTGARARNLYTLAWDSTNRKWILTPPVSGGGGSGTVTTVGFTAANGFTGNFSNPTTTPNLTIGTSVTGLLFGNGTAIGAVTVSSPLTYSGGVLGIQNGSGSQPGAISASDWTTFNNKQNALSGTGYLKFSGTTPSYLTPTQVTADLNLFSSSLQGLTPASGGGTTNFLRADGTWAAPPGGGGSIPPNIGSGFRIYSPQVPGFRSLICSGCTLDSTTNTNALTLTVPGGGTSLGFKGIAFGSSGNAVIWDTTKIKHDSATNGHTYLFVNSSPVGQRTDVFYGNSETFGFPTPNVIRPYPVQVTAKLGDLLTNSAISGRTLQNTGWAGASGYILQDTGSIPSYTTSFGYLFNNIGVNDIRARVSGNDSASFRSAYRLWVIAAIRKGWPATRIVLVSPVYVPSVTYKNDSITYSFTAAATQNTAIGYGVSTQAVATEFGTIFVSGYSATVGLDYLYQADSLHMGRYANERVASAILSAVDTIRLNGQRLAVNGPTTLNSLFLHSTPTDTSKDNNYALGLSSTGRVSILTSANFRMLRVGSAVYGDDTVANFMSTGRMHAGALWLNSYVPVPTSGTGVYMTPYSTGTNFVISNTDWATQTGLPISFNGYGHGQVVIGSLATYSDLTAYLYVPGAAVFGGMLVTGNTIPTGNGVGFQFTGNDGYIRNTAGGHIIGNFGGDVFMAKNGTYDGVSGFQANSMSHLLNTALNANPINTVQLLLGAGTNLIAAMRFTAAAPTTANIDGNIAWNTGRLIVDSSTTRRDSVAYLRDLRGLSVGGTPGGANTQIQFNNSGAFGGSSSLTWSGTVLTSNALAISTLTNAGASDSVLTWDPATKAVRMRSGTFTLNVGNGVTAPTTDSIKLGGTLNQNTTIAQAGFGLTISGGQIVLGAAAGTRNWSPLTNTVGTSNFSLQTGTLNDILTAPSGTLGLVVANGISVPILSATNTSVTYTEAYSFYIAGAPGAGTNVTIGNSYALGVSGSAKLTGVVNALSFKNTTVTESAASSLTISTQWSVFNGTIATWTLPALSASLGLPLYIKNAGSGILTVQRAGSDNIYDTGSVTSLTVAPGAAIILIGGSAFWYKN